MIDCNNVEHLVEIESTKKFWGQTLGKNGPKSGPKLGFWPFSQVWLVSFP